MRNYCRKLIAVLCACMIAVSAMPVVTVGCAEEDMSLTFVNGVAENPVPQLTLDEYSNNIHEIIEVWKNTAAAKNEYIGMSHYIYSVYYFMNYKYCRDIRPELVNYGVISEGYDNWAYTDINYYLRSINEKLLNNKKTDQLMDISICIVDPETKELARNALANYISAYEKATIHCDEYREYMEELAVLKTRDYVTWLYFRNMLYDLYEHCILQNFKQKEIKEYFATNGKKLEPDKVNSKKYKNVFALSDELESKQDKTELEQYIELFLGIVPTFQTGEDVDRFQQAIYGDLFFDSVKNGRPDSYPDITFEDAFNKYYENPKWSYSLASTEENVIVFEGEGVYQGINRRVELYFRMNDDNTFTLFTGNVYDTIYNIKLYNLDKSQDLAPLVYDPFRNYYRTGDTENPT